MISAEVLKTLHDKLCPLLQGGMETTNLYSNRCRPVADLQYGGGGKKCPNLN